LFSSFFYFNSKLLGKTIFSSTVLTISILVSQIFFKYSITSLTNLSGADAQLEIQIFKGLKPSVDTLFFSINIFSSIVIFISLLESTKIELIFNFSHICFNLFELLEFCEPTIINKSKSFLQSFLTASCLLVVAKQISFIFGKTISGNFFFTA
jgi:hypothetical protein